MTGDTLLLQYIHFGNLSITALKIHVLTLISIMKNYCKTNVILKSNDFEKLKGSLKIRKCHVVTRDFSFQTLNIVWKIRWLIAFKMTTLHWLKFKKESDVQDYPYCEIWSGLIKYHKIYPRNRLYFRLKGGISLSKNSWFIYNLFNLFSIIVS